MFDLFAMLLSSVASFLFPIFASYKALKTSDPAQLTPWLMYWVVFSCCLLVESWLSFILAWVPFYGYIRLFFFLYLILPQTQGARAIYEQRIHPFLQENEACIDDFIASAHSRLRAAGITYVRQAVGHIRSAVLGLPPQQPPPAPEPPAGPQNYIQSLLGRFSIPTARWAAAANSGSDFYNVLTAAVSAAGAGSGPGSGPGRSAQLQAPIVPPNLGDSADRINFIAAQRERLNMVLAALDREAQELQRGDASAATPVGRPAPPGAFGPAADAHDDADESAQRPPSGLSSRSGLSKSRSETDFEKVEAESGAEDDDGNFRRRHASGAAAGASWVPWGWSGGADTGKSSARED